MKRLVSVLLATSSVLAACSDSAGSKATNDAALDGGTDAPFASGSELRITVPETGRVYVKLATPSVVTPAGDAKASLEWDVAFEGFDVFTNSGLSGGGGGAAFGPLDTVTYIGDTAPQVPFLFQDKSGGAFLDWYDYDGSAHSLWSRYHVYGIRDGARLWKVQVLAYYGQRDGAAVPALYKVRYAELTEGANPAAEVVELDGTAGGVAGADDAGSGCFDFGTKQQVMLSPKAQRTSSAWHLCFRREAISVNGELGGPRGIVAFDLDGAKTATEALSDVKAKTAESEATVFDAVTRASFEGKAFRGDRVVTAFSDKWIEPGSTPLTPVNATWLVQHAAGTQKYFLGFSRFETPTAKSPGTVVVQIKPVKG